MPTAYLKKLAKLNNTSVDKLEKFWSQAKEIAKSEGQGKSWGLITTIFQNKLKKEGFKVKAFFTTTADTDELDDADLGINVDHKEYHKQKAKMTPLKERIIQAYEAFIRRKEKEAEMSWKKTVKYRGGGNDEAGLMEDYEDRWGEKFPHKNTMTLYEFYKIMMANYDTREYIYDNSKKDDLKGILTGKLFEYLASGRPILCIGPEDGDASRIISDTHAGTTVDFEDKEKIKEVVINLFERYRSNNLFHESHIETESYSRQNLTKRYVELINKIAI